MKWVRAALTVAMALVALVAIAMSVLYFVLGQPDPAPPRPAVADYSRHNLQDRVGVYQMPDGRRSLLTFSAHGALQLYAIGDRGFRRGNLLARRIEPRKDDEFEWTTLDDETRALSFTRQDGHITGFEWRDRSGTHTATRIDSGFRQFDVSWASGDVQLAGTAFVPHDAHTGAVVIHGSGESDRDNLWYLHFVMALVDAGVAVVLPDKRGSGRSGGDWRDSSFEDFAADAVAGRAELARMSGLPPAAIGFLGISQGGMVAPLAAVRAGDAAFVINIVGGVVTPHDSLAHETVGNLNAMGLPSNFVTHPWAMGIAKRRRPNWWALNEHFDPLVYWRQVEAPVLMIFAGADTNTPVETSLQRLGPLAHRDNFDVRVLDGAGHALINQDTREILPEVLDGLASWTAHR